jgi:hypothetical protein
MNPSSLIFDKFKKTNPSDWVKVAEKELNGKPLESLNYHYNNEIIMPPVLFSGKEDKKLRPIVWRKNNLCQRGISFNQIETLKEKEIEAFISIGINNFKLNVTEKNKSKAEELKKLFPSCYWLVVNQEKRDFTNLLISNNIYLKSLEKDPIQQILENFQLAISLIQRLEINEGNINNFLTNIYFSREINANYLFEISLGRAQRIVWRNILKALEINNPAPPLFISTLPVLRNKFNDHFLVEATTKTLSAMLGGSDLIYLEFDEITEEMRAENLAHIHNIFTMESGIGESIDPIAGSFYLDNLTTKIAKQIWDKLKS